VREPVSAAPPRSDRRVWWRLVGRTRPFRGTLTLGILASVVAAAAGAAWASLVGPLLQAVLQGSEARWGPVTLTRADLTSTLPLAIIGVAAVKAVSAWLHAGLMGRVAQRVLSALRSDLYERLLALPPRWYETRHSGELLSRFTADVAQVEFAAAQALSSVVKDSLQVAALVALCAVSDLRLFLVVFLVLPGTVIPVSRFARAAKKTATRSQASVGALSMLAAEHLHALPVVQAYRVEPRALAHFDEEQSRYLAVMRRSLFIRGAFSPTTEFLGVLGIVAALLLGTAAVGADPQLAGKLVSFLAAALLMYQPVKALSHTASQVAQGAAAAQRLFEILDAEPEAEPPGAIGPLTRGLSASDLVVTYPDGREALSGVSFEVPAGAHVALVGPSGAGKSTVLSALLGFVAPTRGRLTWDGVDLATVSRRSLRAQVAWVPQEPVLLSGSVRDNLRLARPDATDAQLWTALRRAHAEAFVTALPGGLDGDVGERGSRLSGGQRQRLAIARAFLREPSLLVLDEPTSALDAATEAEVQAGLEELMQGRTTLVVAHRLSTVRRASTIVVLDAGRVAEAGSYEALIDRGGLFARLVAASHDGVLAPTSPP
jgi:subfamily B ATP-binding cassette protein MsbA